MVLPIHLQEQAERCRRLARYSADDDVRDGLLRLADEYTARAAALENRRSLIQSAASGDQGPS